MAIPFTNLCNQHNLMPFDGYNPHSIVIMDNFSIHHVPGIKEMIEETGALLLFLPPYSPDFNPIEEAFSKEKSVLRKLDQEAEVFEDTEELVLAAFSTITPQDCQQWIRHAHVTIRAVVMCSCIDTFYTN